MSGVGEFDIEEIQRRETQRLTFESLRIDHAASLFPVFSDPFVCQSLNAPPPESIEKFEEDFQRRISGPKGNQQKILWVNFAVREKMTCRFIGRIEAAVNLNCSGGNWAEVGYVFHSTEWGKSYAAESLEWLHRELKREFQVTEFWATTSPGNERSRKLLMKTGYQLALLRNDRPVASYDAGDEVFCKIGG